MERKPTGRGPGVPAGAPVRGMKPVAGKEYHIASRKGYDLYVTFVDDGGEAAMAAVRTVLNLPHPGTGGAQRQRRSR